VSEARAAGAREERSVSGPEARRSAAVGVAYAAGAYVWWGVLPLYFRMLRGVPAPEVLTHRIVWSLCFMVLFVTLRRSWPEVRRQLTPRVLAQLALSATFISANWLIYIWAVNADHVLDASLGYYINPLVSVLLAVVFLHERLSRRQVIAIALAGVGVVSLVIRLGTFPWIALSLAITFGLYGLIRKRVPVDAAAGLLAEVAVLAPLALGYAAWLAVTGQSHFPGPPLRTALLAAAGVVTAVPLMWFANGVRRLRLATVGLLQYVNPTLQFAVAVAVFGEPFGPAHRFAFVCIWIGLAVYASEAIGVGRAPRAARTA
jgi:chloramphenicol-sensitive protein RarD